jgi:hypothetical protein
MLRLTAVASVPVNEHAAVDEEAATEPRTAAQRRTLWITGWGVVLAASTAFSLGYAASRRADPSVGASRPPGWPLILSLLVVLVSLWFVLAPRLHQWPFAKAPIDDPHRPDEP